MAGIIVDIGSGDGRFAYELGRKYPDRLIIAIDPSHKMAQKISLKVNKKPAKGGLANVIYALGSIEDLPSELTGKVNQVFINFPWAGLLDKILAADASAWSAIKNICQPGALINILFSYSPRDRVRPMSKVDLADKLSRLGLEVKEFSEVDTEIMKKYPTSWAKRLAYGRDRKFYYMRISNERNITSR